jgi:hypothetical protein
MNMRQEFHLEDRELLMALDGELSAREASRVESHLATCWACRVRKEDLETAIREFMGLHRTLGRQIPPSDGPRALLKAQVSQLSEVQRVSGMRWLSSFTPRLSWIVAAAGLMLALATGILFHSLSARYAPRLVAVTVPNPTFTPGATVLLGQREVCTEASVKNKAVPVALQKKVFDEYGIRAAEPGAYEVDYLITPALGGADDIHNLWPQSSRATPWNAQVKDALEDHLRNLVCDGRLDLATAQREIAGNWIEAYKKYFQTDRPPISPR